MEEIDAEFVELVAEFLESSKDIRDAAEMTEGDPIKQDMIKGVTKEFLDVCARSEALRALVDSSYQENREYILSELKEITVSQNTMNKNMDIRTLYLSSNSMPKVLTSFLFVPILIY